MILNWLLEAPLGQFVLTMLTAMIPFVELRGAIPMGVMLGLPIPVAVLAGIIGNMIPVPFIIVYLQRIFHFIHHLTPTLNRLITALEERGKSKSALLNKYGLIGLCILVAIPLPGTGAWTGCLVAALMKLRLRRALPVVLLGVCIAAAIVTTITYGVSSLI